MRDIRRIRRITELLVKFWNRPECQDIRFWQMMSYLGAKVFDETKCSDFFYLEDDEFENFLKKILDN